AAAELGRYGTSQVAKVPGGLDSFDREGTIDVMPVGVRSSGLRDGRRELVDCLHHENIRVTPAGREGKICTVRSYAEYCPIAIGAEAIGDRWTPLILRELICGADRFSDIHRGLPRMSRSLLSQRLKQLERIGVIERRAGPTYHLTEAGHELEA